MGARRHVRERRLGQGRAGRRRHLRAERRCHLRARLSRAARRVAACPARRCPASDEYWFYVLGEFANAAWAFEQDDGDPDVLAYRDFRASSAWSAKSSAESHRASRSATSSTATSRSPASRATTSASTPRCCSAPASAIESGRSFAACNSARSLAENCRCNPPRPGEFVWQFSILAEHSRNQP